VCALPRIVCMCNCVMKTQVPVYTTAAYLIQPYFVYTILDMESIVLFRGSRARRPDKAPVKWATATAAPTECYCSESRASSCWLHRHGTVYYLHTSHGPRRCGPPPPTLLLLRCWPPCCCWRAAAAAPVPSATGATAEPRAARRRFTSSSLISKFMSHGCTRLEL
jgi:hypothetical protein